MIELTDLGSLAGEWLSGGGADADVVVSSRVRLARNVAGYPFLTRASEEKRGAVEDLVRASITGSSLKERVNYHDLAAMEHVERQFLVERHLISRDHAFAQGPRGVAFAPDERISVMVNEEDHLRIQSLRAGLQLREAFVLANEVDNALEERIDYAFSSQFGYLTACPTNLGTGMRVSVMLHLPALVITREIEKVFQAVNKINLAVRGLYGEGTQASGDFYQISNQVTLGKTEDEIVDNLASVMPQIVKYERKVRQTLLQAKRVVLEDKIWRALGVLRVARTITSEETLELLSLVRLGVHLKAIEGISTGTINELLVLSQPAHLQKVENAKLSSHERDVVRARYIRERLSKDMGPVN
jgi:protein arginine kinase